jgi:hypothetical protein
VAASHLVHQCRLDSVTKGVHEEAGEGCCIDVTCRNSELTRLAVLGYSLSAGTETRLLGANAASLGFVVSRGRLHCIIQRVSLTLTEVL